MNNSPFNRFSPRNFQNIAWWLEVYTLSPEYEAVPDKGIAIIDRGFASLEIIKNLKNQ